MTHTKKILLVTFYDITARIGASFWTHMDGNRQTNGQIDMEVEIVI